jgi:hypothetical protein
MPVIKRLEEKLARIRAGTATDRDFILADAKDADMAFGVTAPGPRRDGAGWKTLPEYLDQIRAVIRQDLVDIMLVSASNLERLAVDERCFDDSSITPAARANDTTDIWLVRGGTYAGQRSRPFRSATIDHIQRGGGGGRDATAGANLGLYSVTFTNDVEADVRTLQAFAEFRAEAERKQFRYFLEVFRPNVDTGLPSAQLGGFLNDQIVRCLAGVPSAARPLFLKIPYLGPAALEELAGYDPSLIVGILGGGAGTTLDAFQLLHDAKAHGARLALFGRKINLADDPLALIAWLRRIADGAVSPVEAVQGYHADLQRAGIEPVRPLSEDLQLTDPVLRGR